MPPKARCRVLAPVVTHSRVTSSRTSTKMVQAGAEVGSEEVTITEEEEEVRGTSEEDSEGTVPEGEEMGVTGGEEGGVDSAITSREDLITINVVEEEEGDEGDQGEEAEEGEGSEGEGEVGMEDSSWMEVIAREGIISSEVMILNGDDTASDHGNMQQKIKTTVKL